MTDRILVFISIMLLIFSSFAFSQSKETGAIWGTVFDDTDTPLPGVTLVLSSPSLMGDRTVLTDAQGNYRFPVLPPGDYVIYAELQGFTKVIQENIRLTTTVKLTVNLVLKPAAIEEETTVFAQSPTIDIKSSETASVTLENEILQNIPYSNIYFDIVGLAPGVSSHSAFGASNYTGISYQVDGVDLSDPEEGGAWVLLDPNIIEEAKVMGLGLPAEYGNYTGTIFNVITKSGGNELSGYFAVTFQGKADDWPKAFWQSENNAAYIENFPDMTSPVARLTDFSAHLGGPIKKDKIWFYLGAQYYNEQDFPAGFPESGILKQPKFFLKITAQVTPKTNLTTFLEYDRFDWDNGGGGARISPEATFKSRSPELVGNFSLNHILNSTTFFDLKMAFFWGENEMNPEAGDVSGHWDLNDNKWYVSRGYYYYLGPLRYQVNASLTHYAEDFMQGDHDFKFGVEFERSRIHKMYRYTGANAFFYYDFTGYGPYGYYYTGHYLAYQYEGYDTQTKSTRLEGFVQDSWKISNRLNVNIGLRVTQVWGAVRDVPGSVYQAFRLAPRIGFTFDILGDQTTILKAHYGQFTEGMYTAFHDRLNPEEAYNGRVGYYWDVFAEQWVEWLREPHINYSMDKNIKHPCMEQFVLGIERELFKDASFSVTLIYRKWKNIIGFINNATVWQPVDIFVEELNRTFTLYEPANPDEFDMLIKSIKKGDNGVTQDPYRSYWGFELLFNKRFSHNWQLLASYVYSRAKGTIDNGLSDDIGRAGTWWTPWGYGPNFWINGDGYSTNTPPHMLKLQGTYVFPYGIQCSSSFRAVSGNAWAQQYWTSPLSQGRVAFFTERRGSHHYAMQTILDLRLEKIFSFTDRYRLGLMFDVFNVFNADTITSWGTLIGYDWIPGEYPSTDGHELYGIVPPRQIRLGLRLMF
jgi:hypothetical protein